MKMQHQLLKLAAFTLSFGVLAGTSLPAQAKSWVWCSDNKCTQRKTFSDYASCREYTETAGGYCY